MPEGSEPFDYLDAAPDGVVFVVCRLEPREGRTPIIHLQGIAEKREIAVLMCRDVSYFFAPMPLNISLPHSPTEWIGVTWPHLVRPPKE